MEFHANTNTKIAKMFSGHFKSLNIVVLNIQPINSSIYECVFAEKQNVIYQNEYCESVTPLLLCYLTFHMYSF
jgi:hypothetical protein